MQPAQPSNPVANSQHAQDSFTTFSKSVRLVSKYVEDSTALINHCATQNRDSGKSRLLAETLCSTRLRAKHSLDALVNFVEKRQAERQVQFGTLEAIIHQAELCKQQDLEFEACIDLITKTDTQLQKNVEQLAASHLDIEEDLAQLKSILGMMQRACSVIITTTVQES